MNLRRLLKAFVLVAGLWLAAPALPAAKACPMCQAANEADTSKEANRKPRAYMYSILFMLGMPLALTACFGIGLYRLSRKAPLPPADPAAPAHHGFPPGERLDG